MKNQKRKTELNQKKNKKSLAKKKERERVEKILDSKEKQSIGYRSGLEGKEDFNKCCSLFWIVFL